MPLGRGLSAALAAGALLLSVDAEPEGPRAAALDVLAVDADVPKSALDRASAALRQELGRSFSLVPPAQIEDLRAGRDPVPDLSAVNALIAKGKSQFVNVQFKPAASTLKAARGQLLSLQPRLRDYKPLLEALSYLAAALTNAGDRKTAEMIFMELARLRPEHRLDPSLFSPPVIQAFEKVRAAEAKIPRGRLSVTSTPPGATVYVDEVAMGQTPLVVPVGAAEHQVRVDLAGHVTWTERVAVASYGKVERQVALRKHGGAEALRALESGAATGGSPESMTQAGAAVAAALKVSGVVVAVLGLAPDGYVLSVVHLSAQRAGRAIVIPLGANQGELTTSLPQALAELAVATAAPAQPGAEGKVVARVVGGTLPANVVNFEKHGAGFSPESVLVRRPPRTVARAGDEAEPPKPTPLYARWWLWAGVLVVAGAAAGGAYWFYGRPQPAQNAHFYLDRQNP